LYVSAIDSSLHVPEISLPETPPLKQRRRTRLVSSLGIRLLLSVFAAGSAFLVRSYITRFTGPLPPFLIFNATVLLMALYGGVWSGLTVTGVSALLVEYWVLAPAQSFHMSHSADVFALVDFCAVGVFTSVLSELYRRNLRKLGRLQTEQAVDEQRQKTAEQIQLVSALESQADRLRETEQLLTTMVDFVPQIVWMGTPEGANTYCNKRWVDYTGLTLEESAGDAWNAHFHPDDRQKAWEAWSEAIRTGEAYEVESRIRASDGSYRWFLMRGTPMRSGNGTVERWFGTCTDIEDIKRADEELQLTKQRFELAIRPTPVTVFNQDLDLRMTWIYNPAGGSNVSQILGKRDSEFLERAEDATAVEAIKMKAIQTGELQHSEIVCLVKGVERTYDLVVEPLRDGSGKITGITGAAINITERKQQEKLLRESEARFRSIYSATLEYIGIVDVNGNLLDCNDAPLQFGGYAREDVVGKLFWEGPWFAHTPGMPEVIQDAVVRGAAGQTSRAELTLNRPSGEAVTFDFTLLPVFDSDGKVMFLVPKGREISELKRAQEALIKSEKLAAVGRLASAIAHEINNPLEAVTNILYLANTSPECPDSMREYLLMAEDELLRVAHVTRQTLGFYRESVSPISVPLTTIVDSAVDLHRRKILERRAEVRKQYRGDFHITAIPGELRQVFSNLLANSLDAIERGGTVAIRTSRVRSSKTGQPQLRIIVADNGSGIAPEILERIFEPLFTTKIATGSGLGLWVVRQLIEKHDGTVRVRSCTSGEHRGTALIMTLPEREV
jgi:PAS domain S-box-containing protein